MKFFVAALEMYIKPCHLFLTKTVGLKGELCREA